VTPSAPIHTTLQTKHPSPAIARPGRFSLNLSCLAIPVASTHYHLAAYESEIPCPSCCISLGLDSHLCPCSWAFGRSSLSIRGMQRGAYHLSIPICKPPNSPSSRIGSSEHIELHDRIAPTPPHLLSSFIAILLHYCREFSAQPAFYCPPSRRSLPQLAFGYIAHTPHCPFRGTSSPVCNGRCRCTSTRWSLASTT